MTAATTAPSPRDTRHAVASGFRTDIQGLRAIAVVLVLLYHAGLPWVPGGYVGVDVFFVISGFLITGLIIREIERTGRLSLASFYARRAKRLLPATAVTFLGVTVLTMAVLPITRWTSIAGDMVASALYVVNWRLADRSIDYLAEGQAASPLQHFWSLAIEEQFYVVWPLLIVMLVWWTGRAGGGVLSRRRLAWGLVALSVPSLVWSVWLTATDPGPAYLVTTTRIWELAIGALLAVGARHTSVRSALLRTAIGWVGLAMIVAAAHLYSAATPFPGMAAAVPTVGAAAVIWAGMGDGSGRVRLLDLPVMQDVGALSYSLYLWHWPLLVAAASVWGDADGQLWLPTALMVVTAAAVPAWFTYRVVELPLHRSRVLGRPRNAALAALVCIGVGLLAAAALHWSSTRTTTAPESDAVTTTSTFGAAALGEAPATSAAGEVRNTVPSIVPSLGEAPGDNADVYSDGCHQDQHDSSVVSCTYGDETSAVVIALVGDSHAAQWQPALRALAEENGWRLDTYTKSACFFGAADVWSGNDDAPYENCREWADQLTADLVADPPSIVATSASGGHRAVQDGAPVTRPEANKVLSNGLVDTWSVLEGAGVEVVALADTPWVGLNMPDCVAGNLQDLSACSVSRAEALATSAVEFQRAAAAQIPEVTFVDLNDWICPRDQCAPVIGGVLVFRDGHHLTATYARSLAPRLEDIFLPLIEK